MKKVFELFGFQGGITTLGNQGLQVWRKNHLTGFDMTDTLISKIFLATGSYEFASIRFTWIRCIETTCRVANKLPKWNTES